MNTLQFLKETLEEINPKLALGNNNPIIEFLDLTAGEFDKLRTAVYNKYNKVLRINHLFECVGLAELSEKIERLHIENGIKYE